MVKEISPYDVTAMQSSINKRNTAIGVLALATGAYVLVEILQAVVAGGIAAGAVFSGIGIAVLALVVIATLAYLYKNHKSAETASIEHRKFEKLHQPLSLFNPIRWFKAMGF